MNPLAVHIIDLAACHRLTVRTEASFGPHGLFYPPREIMIPPIRDPTAYFVGLHEIGHAVFKHRERTNPRQELSQEVEAWEFALKENLHVEPPWQSIDYCLMQYLDWHGQKGYIPSYNNRIWKLVKIDRSGLKARFA